ncbi:hypothetical protein HanRHA438_Chr07g0293971 [Helianthus annuus]|nr:hypothetical protein HanIR_Chr07g0305391 [Helianthus annuus]KAJ0907024.1 hypothetical protein HanRHA438_Chr07g0293971 [Helianthus annuus]
MLVFHEDDEAEEFLEAKDLWKGWFSNLDLWAGQSLAYERIAWLKFFGVPLHLAENKVFDSVAELFGKVLHKSQLSPDDRDLSFNRVGVLVDNGLPISDTVTLSWKRKKFKIWVVEEQAEWLPDCVSETDWPEVVARDVEDKQSPVGVADSGGNPQGNVNEVLDSHNVHGVGVGEGSYMRFGTNDGKLNVGGPPKGTDGNQGGLEKGLSSSPFTTVFNQGKSKKKKNLLTYLKINILEGPMLAVRVAITRRLKDQELLWRSPNFFPGQKGRCPVPI